MNIDSLRYFMNVAECLNFTKAAKKSHISQTAMSFQISSMEKELGFILFYRDKRSVQLTRAGKAFYEHVRKIVLEYETAVHNSKKIECDLELKIVFASSFLADLFLERLKSFQQLNPQIELRLFVIESTKIVNCLENNEADAIVALVYDMEENNAVEVEVLREDTLYIYANDQSELAGCEMVTAEMLQDFNVIICNPKDITGSYRAIFDCYQNYGYEPKSYIVTNNVDEIVLNTRMGKGISILPQYAVKHAGEQKLVEIPFMADGKKVTVQTGIGYLKSNISSNLKTLVKFLK